MEHMITLKVNDEEMATLNKAIRLLDPEGINRLPRSQFIRRAIMVYAREIIEENEMLNTMFENEKE